MLTENSPQPQEVDMSAGPTSPGPFGDRTPSDTGEAHEYLVAALHAARSDALQAGADPDAVTADLEDRLRRVRQMLAVEEDVPASGDA
jgi:hypothetical protein